MGMNVGGNNGGMKSDINVTPLVDVVLVLLIIFMVVTPELQRGKEVHLPHASTAKERKDGGDPVIVSLKSDKSIYVEQESVTLESIADRVKQILEVFPGKSFIIKGDSALTYGDVRGLISALRKAGAQGVSLAADTNEEHK